MPDSMSGTIAVPARKAGRFPAFAKCLLRLEKPEGTVVDWEFGPDVAANRNALVQRALDRSSAWVFFVDDDMLFGSDLLERLLAHKQPVVAALYLRRGAPPFMPLAFTRRVGETLIPIPLKDLPPAGAVRVHGVGTGGVLIHREVFERVAEPWFEWSMYLPDIDALGYGEDLVFCEKVNNAGLEVHADLGARLGHILSPSGPTTGVLAAVWPEFDDKGWRWHVRSEPDGSGRRPPPGLALRWPKQGATLVLDLDRSEE